MHCIRSIGVLPGACSVALERMRGTERHQGGGLDAVDRPLCGPQGLHSIHRLHHRRHYSHILLLCYGLLSLRRTPFAPHPRWPHSCACASHRSVVEGGKGVQGRRGTDAGASNSQPDVQTVTAACNLAPSTRSGRDMRLSGTRRSYQRMGAWQPCSPRSLVARQANAAGGNGNQSHDQGRYKRMYVGRSRRCRLCKADIDLHVSTGANEATTCIVYDLVPGHSIQFFKVRTSASKELISAPEEVFIKPRIKQACNTSFSRRC